MPIQSRRHCPQCSFGQKVRVMWSSPLLRASEKAYSLVKQGHCSTWGGHGNHEEDKDPGPGFSARWTWASTLSSSCLHVWTFPAEQRVAIHLASWLDSRWSEKSPKMPPEVREWRSINIDTQTSELEWMIVDTLSLLWPRCYSPHHWVFSSAGSDWAHL